MILMVFLPAVLLADLPGLDSWKVDCAAPTFHDVRLTQGETLTLEPRYQLGGRQVALPEAAEASLFFRLFGATGTPYVITGAVYDAAAGVVRITIPSTVGLATNRYSYWIQLASNTTANLRARGDLYVLPGYGSTGAPPPYVQLLTSNTVAAMIAAGNTGYGTDTTARADAAAATNWIRTNTISSAAASYVDGRFLTYTPTDTAARAAASSATNWIATNTVLSTAAGYTDGQVTNSLKGGVTVNPFYVFNLDPLINGDHLFQLVAAKHTGPVMTTYDNWELKTFNDCLTLPPYLNFGFGNGEENQVLFGGGMGWGDITPEQIGAARTNATYVWQGAATVATTNYATTPGGPTTNQNDRWELIPYTGTRTDSTGTLAISSSDYIASITYSNELAKSSGGTETPKNPMRFSLSRTSPTSFVFTAFCSASAYDAMDYYFAYVSNIVVSTYDRPGMVTGSLTNDTAGIVARVDDPDTNDARRVMNYGSTEARITARKTEIADEAWNRTPGGRDVPDKRMVTLDEPLVQQGAIAYLNSGDYYVFSYEGGDWRSSTTGSVWQIGPSGRLAFEIAATNRMLNIQAISVAGGYVTLDINTNWVVGTPSIEFTGSLLNPQWISCPAQVMTDNTNYWRGVCPTGTNGFRYYRAISPAGENVIRSHFRHEFLGGITIGTNTFRTLTELKAALGALP